MPGTRWLAAAAVLATAVLATVLLTTGLLPTRLLTTGRPPTAGTGPPGPALRGRLPAIAALKPAFRGRLPAIAALNAVSCPSPRLCMVIGDTPSHSTVVLRWNGRRWADVPVPRPATDRLAAIWCGSATSCLAVGDTAGNAPGSQSGSLAEVWKGYGWLVLPVANPAHAFSSALVGIDCTSSTVCTAVGSYTTAKSGYDPPTYALAEGWNGQAWRLEPVADPAAKATELSSVSCPSADACTAVGTSTSGGLVAERWNGAAWSAQEPEPSGGAGPGDLNAVSCPTPGNCTVVGDSGGDDNQGLSESWNGRSWGTQSMVAPSDWSTLSGVTCFSATACMAVGSTDGQRGDITLAARWNGRSWSLRATRNGPRPAINSTLGAISCASPTACMATGVSDRGVGKTDYTTGRRPLAQWWNGTKWRMLPTP